MTRTAILLAAAAIALCLARPVPASSQEMSEKEFLESLPPDVAAASLGQRLAVGEPIPQFQVPALGQGPALNREAVLGKPSALIFFAVDSEARKERSLGMLQQASRLQDKLGTRVRFFGVCSYPSGCADIQGTLRKASVTLPAYNDERRDAYTLFGIFMMPEAIVISPDGKVLAKVPYSSGFQEQLEQWMRVALGEITPEQLAENLRIPTEDGRTKEEKEYLHHLQLARVMAKRRQYPQAAAEFEAAAKLQPTAAEPLVELGLVRLKMKEWGKAEKFFSQALELSPDDLSAVGGLGIALHRQGKEDEALVELTDAASTVLPMPEVLAALAEVYAARGDKDKALAWYAKAVARWTAMLEQCEGQTVGE